MYPVLTVFSFVYSQYNCNLYQQLRSDTEGSAVNHTTGMTVLETKS